MQTKSAGKKSAFTPDEISYLQSQRLGRIAPMAGRT